MSVERQAVIRSKSGLHARPAARVVKEANRFRSQVELVTQGSEPEKSDFRAVAGAEPGG